MHTHTSSSSWWWLLVLCLFAAVGGLCCVVLPPYMIPGGIKQPYSGWTIFPWFQTAINNVAFMPTWSLLFALGFALGVIQPRFWWLLGPLTMLLLPALLGVDLVRYPTSHNLWPFECVFYLYIGWPAVVGALVGFLLRYGLHTRRAP